MWGATGKFFWNRVNSPRERRECENSTGIGIVHLLYKTAWIQTREQSTPSRNLHSYSCGYASASVITFGGNWYLSCPSFSVTSPRGCEETRFGPMSSKDDEASWFVWLWVASLTKNVRIFMTCIDSSRVVNFRLTLRNIPEVCSWALPPRTRKKECVSLVKWETLLIKHLPKQ